MDSKKAQALLKKYWEGETDLSEELKLKAYFSKIEKHENPEPGYFRFLAQKSSESPLEDDFEKHVLQIIDKNTNISSRENLAMKYWLFAASLALIISVSIIFKNEIFKVNSPAESARADTFEDPQKAFEETKKVLLLLSSKLNQGGHYARKISKFEQSQEILKQNQNETYN
ncbi:MAG: hypothetical protein MI975_24130 [Cytophagales bacterium]|nr:hypothetical protein [Cytophagales bacterium]